MLDVLPIAALSKRSERPSCADASKRFDTARLRDNNEVRSGRDADAVVGYCHPILGSSHADELGHFVDSRVPRVGSEESCIVNDDHMPQQGRVKDVAQFMVDRCVGFASCDDASRVVAVEKNSVGRRFGP